MSHAERDHAVLSASGAHRWMTCPASALLEQEFPDTTSEAAKEGTLAHELAEAKVRHYFFTKAFNKRKLNAVVKELKENPLWKDEMEGFTDDYLDYIKQEALAFSAKPYVAIEKKVDFSGYVPEGFGTADCVLISGQTLHIIDLKYGKGVPVGAEKNPQLMLYALGAYEAYRMIYPLSRIEMSIVQPRLPDGDSKWGCSTEELLEFGRQAAVKAELALSVSGAFHPEEKACKFCRARRQCRARAEYNVRLAGFTDKKPPLISNEEAGQFLLQGEDVASWLSDLKDYALAQCLAGHDVPGWKAVEGRGSREWTDMDQAFAVLQENGISEALLWERKPLTLAQVEKTVGKKPFTEYVGNLIVKKSGKPALAKESDKRAAISNTVTAQEAFKED